MEAVISPGELSWQKNPVYSHVNHYKLFVHVISLSIYRQRIRLFMSDSKIVDTALGTAKTRMTKPALEHHKVLLRPQPGRALHIWFHFQSWSCTRGVPRSAETSEKLLKAGIKGKAMLLSFSAFFNSCLNHIFDQMNMTHKSWVLCLEPLKSWMPKFPIVMLKNIWSRKFIFCESLTKRRL